MPPIDLNIIDFDRLQIHHPVLINDLPTGAPRWSQKVTGYDFTILSGEITFENGSLLDFLNLFRHEFGF